MKPEPVSQSSGRFEITLARRAGDVFPTGLAVLRNNSWLGPAFRLMPFGPSTRRGTIRRIRPTRLVVLLWAATVVPAVAQDNPVYQQLTQVGIRLDAETILKLPTPSLGSAHTAEEEAQVLRQVRGRYPLSEFVRPSRVAPFNLQMASVKNARGERTGQTVDLWFVCYGQLDRIREADLFAEFAGLEQAPEDEAAADHELTVAELAARQIQISSSLDERYHFFFGTLLNRVRLGGVTRTVVTRSPHQALVASILDERFVRDQKFPNQWQSQSRDEKGHGVLGPCTPYGGYGGYCQATQLQHSPQAMLVEFHLAFHEPLGWFQGANLLRSKLPMVLQEKVRALRSTLANLAKPEEGPAGGQPSDHQG